MPSPTMSQYRFVDGACLCARLTTVCSKHINDGKLARERARWMRPLVRIRCTLSYQNPSPSLLSLGNDVIVKLAFHPSLLLPCFSLYCDLIAVCTWLRISSGASTEPLNRKSSNKYYKMQMIPISASTGNNTTEKQKMMISLPCCSHFNEGWIIRFDVCQSFTSTPNDYFVNCFGKTMQVGENVQW